MRKKNIERQPPLVASISVPTEVKLCAGFSKSGSPAERQVHSYAGHTCYCLTEKSPLETPKFWYVCEPLRLQESVVSKRQWVK